jgi:hypothetical protein
MYRRGMEKIAPHHVVVAVKRQEQGSGWNSRAIGSDFSNRILCTEVYRVMTAQIPAGVSLCGREEPAGFPACYSLGNMYDGMELLRFFNTSKKRIMSSGRTPRSILLAGAPDSSHTVS